MKTKTKKEIKTTAKKRIRHTTESQPVVQPTPPAEIPPYPLWFRRISLYGIILLILFLIPIVCDPYTGFAELSRGIFFIVGGLLSLIWLSYGLYRAFRYFTKRALCFLWLLFIIGIGLTLCPLYVRARLWRNYMNCRSICFLVVLGLIVGHGLLTVFWKRARKIGWFIFYLGMFVMIPAPQYIYDKMTGNDVPIKIDQGNNVFEVVRERQADVFKPIIYLYPEEETEVFVSLGDVDRLTHTYPPYELGWRVVAEPDGNLTEVRTNRKLYALYWEGRSAVPPIISEGFVVAGKDTISFLEEKLPLLGLNEREAEEFIIYWLPQLESNHYNLIRFLTMDEQEKDMPLKVTPTPDTVIRVMMAFKPLVRPVKIAEQKLPETPERNGFVVVEWGGTKLGTDLIQ